jgi:hypothetical protein
MIDMIVYVKFIYINYLFLYFLSLGVLYYDCKILLYDEDFDKIEI